MLGIAKLSFHLTSLLASYELLERGEGVGVYPGVHWGEKRKERWKHQYSANATSNEIRTMVMDRYLLFANSLYLWLLLKSSRLAVSRAIGDKQLAIWVIIEPETKRIQIRPECELVTKKRIFPFESQVKVTNSSAVVTNSLATEYDLADESLVCSIPLPPLEKLVGAKPISGPKTIKSILKSNSIFKPETLKGVTINEPTSAPVKGNNNVSASKRNSAPTGKLNMAFP
ncbi:hypothetical protein Tco_1303592 [Tanacetum coccineum]